MTTCVIEFLRKQRRAAHRVDSSTQKTEIYYFEDSKFGISVAHRNVAICLFVVSFTQSCSKSTDSQKLNKQSTEHWIVCFFDQHRLYLNGNSCVQMEAIIFWLNYRKTNGELLSEMNYKPRFTLTNGGHQVNLNTCFIISVASNRKYKFFIVWFASS